MVVQKHLILIGLLLTICTIVTFASLTKNTIKLYDEEYDLFNNEINEESPSHISKTTKKFYNDLNSKYNSDHVQIQPSPPRMVHYTNDIRNLRPMEEYGSTSSTSNGHRGHYSSSEEYELQGDKYVGASGSTSNGRYADEDAIDLGTDSLFNFKPSKFTPRAVFDEQDELQGDRYVGWSGSVFAGRYGDEELIDLGAEPFFNKRAFKPSKFTPTMFDEGSNDHAAATGSSSSSSYATETIYDLGTQIPKPFKPIKYQPITFDEDEYELQRLNLTAINMAKKYSLQPTQFRNMGVYAESSSNLRVHDENEYEYELQGPNDHAGSTQSRSSSRYGDEELIDLGAQLPIRTNMKPIKQPITLYDEDEYELQSQSSRIEKLYSKQHKRSNNHASSVPSKFNPMAGHYSTYDEDLSPNLAAVSSRSTGAQGWSGFEEEGFFDFLFPKDTKTPKHCAGCGGGGGGGGGLSEIDEPQQQQQPLFKNKKLYAIQQQIFDEEQDNDDELQFKWPFVNPFARPKRRIEAQAAKSNQYGSNGDYHLLEEDQDEEQIVIQPAIYKPKKKNNIINVGSTSSKSTTDRVMMQYLEEDDELQLYGGKVIDIVSRPSKMIGTGPVTISA